MKVLHDKFVIDLEAAHIAKAETSRRIEAKFEKQARELGAVRVRIVKGQEPINPLSTALERIRL